MKKPNITKRQFVTVTTLLLIAVALTATTVSAISPAKIFTITSGSYPIANGYTIYQDGANFKAKDETGQNYFVSSTADATMQAAATALYNEGGGTLSLENAKVFNMHQKLDIQGGVIIEGNYAILNFSDVNDYCILISGNTPTQMAVGIANPTIIGAQIQDLTIAGDETSKGVKIVDEVFTKVLENVIIVGHQHEDASGLTLEGCLQTTYTNCHIYGNTKGLTLINSEYSGCNENFFQTCHITTNNQTGISFESTESNPSGISLNIANMFETCAIEGNGEWGIVLGAGYKTILRSCWFELNTQGDIRLTSWEGYGAAWTTIEKCFFNNDAVDNIRLEADTFTILKENELYGYLNATTGSSYTTIDNNRFWKTPNIIAGAPQYPLSIHANTGFKTEAFSAGTQVPNGNSSVTVNTALDVPTGEYITYVQCSVSGADPATIFYTVGQKTITFYVDSPSDGNMFIHWKATYLTPP